MTGRSAIFSCCCVASIILLTSCSPTQKSVAPGEVPTARAVSAADQRYGYEVAQALSQQFPLNNNIRLNERVRVVVNRLSRAAGSSDPWKVYVYESSTFKNAAATRGNFVFVWTGLLKFMKSDDELATVLSHEMGHVLAGHTQSNPAEEARSIMSGVAGQIGRQVLGGSTGSLAAGLAGMAIEEGMKALIVNPELQRKEYEADQIGLFLMADAGFNPEAAVDFWARAARDPDLAGAGIEVLSSHPSSSTRLERVKDLLPQAMARYEDAKFGGKRSYRDFSQVPRSDARQGQWKTVKGLTPVFSSPSIASSITGELEPDTMLEASESSGDWFKIEAPVRGYVRSSDVSRAR